MSVVVKLEDVDSEHPIPLPLRSTVTIRTGALELPETRYEIEIAFEASPFGKLTLKVEDTVDGNGHHPPCIPRLESDDCHQG